MLESQYVYGKILSAEDLINKLDSVSIKSIEEVRDRILNNFLLVLTGDVGSYEPTADLKQLCGL